MKRLLKSKLLQLAVLLCGFCLFYGFFIEPKTLAVRHIAVASPHWRGPPVKIGFLADLHIGGRHVDADRAMDISLRMNVLEPDIILLGGDYISGHTPRSETPAALDSQIDDGITALGKLSAPFGVFAVIGNHDNWYDETYLETLMTGLGIGVLNNQARTIAMSSGAPALCLVGLTDYWTGRKDPEAFSGCADGQGIVSFMHSPDSLASLPHSTLLALAGHTHGGQINLPFIGRRVTATDIGPDYAYGLLDYGEIPVYVTSGIGTSMLPARFRAKPEIVVITLSGAK